MFKLTLAKTEPPIQANPGVTRVESRWNGGTHASFFDMIGVMSESFARGEADKAYIKVVPADISVACPHCGKSVDVCLTKR